MTNAYVTLDTVKDVLEIPDTGEDTRLLAMIEGKSRDVEGYLGGRVFHSYIDTKYFSGNGGLSLMLPDDLISVTTLKEDEDGDGTYETTWAATDYELGPYDADPTGRADARNTKPYWFIEVNTRDNGDKEAFGRGQKRFEMAARWGYSESTKDSGDTVQDNPLSSSSTTLTVTSGANFQVGQTLIIESEQLYVTKVAQKTLTVERGVNGTTAASHAQGTAISIVEYPSRVREATLIEVVREWQMSRANYSSQVGVPETGEVRILGGGLRDITKQKLDPYRLIPV